MAVIYVMSDIHGFYDIMLKNLELINFSNKENKLVLCGDYLDYGPDSCKVLYKIMELIKTYPLQVIAIMGNHEKMFLEFLYTKDNEIWNVEWLGADKNFSTIYTFISMSGKEKIKQLKSVLGYYDFMFRAAKIIKEVIISNHKELIQWLNRLPLYYETETQIFVHAGIDEEAGEYWKYGTSDEYFVSKYLATFGKFYKDIIAGHISTSSIVNDKKFYGVFWDKHSHFYLDGNVKNSYDIPMLVYETDEKKYTKISNTLRILEWNINQNVWLDKKTSIDDFIIKEIVDEQKPDIFVLVEAFNLKGEIKELNEKFKGYRLFFADREAVQNTNEVLIGIKTSTNLEFEAKPQIMPQDHKHPNFLRVDVKINKTPLSIIGTRVLCERDKMKRSEQLATLIEYCKSITIPVLILGDFNDHDCYTVKSQNIRAVFIAF